MKAYGINEYYELALKAIAHLSRSTLKALPIGDIKWYQGKNLGAPRSFLNLLEKNKNYDYYAFCDQDDVWLPNKIERSLSKFNNDDLTPQLVFCNSYIVNEELKPMGKLYNKKLPDKYRQFFT